MRLSVAARLLAQLEAAAKKDSTKNKPTGLLGASGSTTRGAHPIVPRGSRAHEAAGVFFPRKNKKARAANAVDRISETSTWEGVLRNEKSSAQEGRPCDPTSDEPDVGILSCGFNYYCAESQDPGIGGVCTELVVDSTTSTSAGSNHRLLEDEVDPGYFCDPSVPSPYDCDCSNFDVATGTGDFSCVIYEEICFAPCTTACAEVILSRTIESSTQTEYGYCYTLTGSYERSFCLNYSSTDDVGCAMVIDGVTCSSCEQVTCNNDPAADEDLAWDCTNVPGGTQGNGCDGDFIFPFLELIEPCIGDDDIDDEPSPAPAPIPSPGVTLGPAIVPTVAQVPDLQQLTAAPVLDSGVTLVPVQQLETTRPTASDYPSASVGPTASDFPSYSETPFVTTVEPSLSSPPTVGPTEMPEAIVPPTAIPVTVAPVKTTSAPAVAEVTQTKAPESPSTSSAMAYKFKAGDAMILASILTVVASFSVLNM